MCNGRRGGKGELTNDGSKWDLNRPWELVGFEQLLKEAQELSKKNLGNSKWRYRWENNKSKGLVAEKHMTMT